MVKIIVIDDNQSIRENLIDVLETNGFAVFAASNGKEGISLIKTIIPDLILCDIMMPEVDGYEVKSQLLKDEQIAFIPFIFLSALSETRERRKGMILGADDYIIKPFDNQELVESINVRLKKSEKIKKLTKLKESKENEQVINFKDRILITVNSQPKLITVSDIISIKADANYSWISTINENKSITRKLLKEWEKFLPKKDFLRIHQSYIINLNYIEKIEKLSNRSFIIKMKNVKNPLPVSQRYTSEIKSKFSI